VTVTGAAPAALDRAFLTFLRVCTRAGADPAVICGEVERHPMLGDGRGPELEARWYTALRAGTPDFTVYDGDAYLAEAWACWCQFSGPHIKTLARSGYAARVTPATVADLGCGIGWSTAALCRLWPDAKVTGTQLLNTLQARIARLHADSLGLTFPLVEDLSGVGHVDLVFASEYFEHFLDPARHLDEVLTALTPDRLVLASTFTKNATGHFYAYLINGEPVPRRSVARRFNAHLRARGYERDVERFWNDRPALWVRAR
jgi:SAM-dependent methyltransferase